MAFERGFIRDFQELLRRFHVKVVHHIEYDGEENACGDHYVIEGKDFRIEVDETLNPKD